MAKDKKTQKVAAGPATELTKFQKFDMARMDRQQIKGAKYNPRVISENAKKKLQNKLATVGLLAPITVNIRTNNIVGGHQRLACLDALEGRKDYLLDCAMVDLSDMEERECNVFLNSSLAQGDWDLKLLEKLFKEDKIGIVESGFDTGTLYRLFGDDFLVDRAQDLEEFAEAIRKAQERYAGMAKGAKDTDDCDFYHVIVYKNNDMRIYIQFALGLEHERYQNGQEILDLLTPEHHARARKGEEEFFGGRSLLGPPIPEKPTDPA